jgi:hypothetical protein
MPCYAISIREDQDHLLKDQGKLLFFKKKSLALEMCEYMNAVRKRMKTDQVYSVCKVNEKDWKGFEVEYDSKESKDDDAQRNVSGYTKRKALHAGVDGSQADSKDSEGDPQEGKGSSQALPF